MKLMGGQGIRLKPDSIPTTFIFTVEKPKRKKASRSLNTKKTNKLVKNLKHYSASEPIDIENSVENTGLKFGSDGTGTEHLESEGLAQTGDENLGTST